jgi:glucose-1-phosphate adenylyltransferase
MDLRAITPELNLYNKQWPLYTAGYYDAPAKFSFDQNGRRGVAVDSIVAGGSILSGGMVRNSVVGRGCRIHTGALVEESVLFDNVDVGRHAKLRRVIIEKNVRIHENTQIGYDLEADGKLHRVTESGIVVVEGFRSPVEIASIQI